MISYAQNFEDVMLERVFKDKRDGFYIDVGASHPIRQSVTCHFYEKGWHGINVEPEPQSFALLAHHRPRDINLNVALGDEEGRRGLYLGGPFSTLDMNTAQTHASVGVMAGNREIPVSITTLAQICDRCCGGIDIDFLKIDVEGWEPQVIHGANWERYRPRVVLVEATFPNSRESTWSRWESMLTMNRYRPVYFDGLNRFYVREEESELQEHFALPPNLFDGFVLYETVEARQRLGAIYRIWSWSSWYARGLRWGGRLGRALRRMSGQRPSISDLSNVSAKTESS